MPRSVFKSSIVIRTTFGEDIAWLEIAKKHATNDVRLCRDPLIIIMSMDGSEYLILRSIYYSTSWP